MKTIIASILLSLLAVAGYVHFAMPGGVVAAHRETAFERVMRTGTLRCGYNDWAPFFTWNTQTNKPEGFTYELVEDIGKLSGLKIEWVSTVDWGTIPAALDSGKVDSFCAPIFATSVRAKGMLFTPPYGTQDLMAFVRADDTRFDKGGLAALDRPDVRVVGWEGTSTLDDVTRRLPHIGKVALPQNTQTSDAYLYVVTNKADVYFDAPGNAEPFMKNNSGKLKMLANMPPVSRQELSLNAPLGEGDLLNFLTVSLDELRNNGTFEDLYRKYDTLHPGFLKR